MAASFPHNYEVKLSNIDGKIAKLNYESAPLVQGGPPKEFDGNPDDWSPEGMLVGATALCFLTTFRAIHRDESLKIENLDVSANGKLEKTKDGLYFTEILTTVSCSTNDRDAAEKLFNKAEKFCLIANSLKAESHLKLNISDI